MAITTTWFNILIFPGWVFFFLLSLLIEQINSRVYAKFYLSEKNSPMFIPIIEHVKICVKGEREKFSLKSLLQIIVLSVMILLPLFGALLLPINKINQYPRASGIYRGIGGVTEGINGLISFEGDVLLVFIILCIFSIAMFLSQTLTQEKSVKESLTTSIQFLIFDIPLFFALVGPILAKKSLSLSLLSEDIRWIVNGNLLFGFLILLPVSSSIAVFSLALKFDQPFLDRINTEIDIGRDPPVIKNWKITIWNLSMRMMELFIAGVIVTICLGGPHLPIPEYSTFASLANTFNFIFKCCLVVIICVVIRCLRPRMKVSQTAHFSFKILTPISFLSILIIGGYIAMWGIK